MAHAIDCDRCEGKGFSYELSPSEPGTGLIEIPCPGYGWVRYNAKFTYDFGRNNQNSLLSYGMDEESFDKIRE